MPTPTFGHLNSPRGAVQGLNWVWDTILLDWVPETQPGTVSAGSDGALLDGTSASIRATVKDYTNANPLTVIAVDTNGDPTSSGGTVQYAEDTASVAGEQVVMTGAVRNDVRGSLVNADGDRSELQVNFAGDLRVEDVVGQAYLSAILTINGTIEADIQAGNASLTSIESKTPNLVGGRQPVDGSGVTQPVSVAGTVAVSLAATSNVNLDKVNNSNVGLANTGVVGGGTQRVTLATDVALPGGANTIGNVGLVTSIPAGAALIGKVGIDQTTPGTTNRVDVANIDVALSTRLKPADTLAAVTSITNVVHVDDNAGSLTVDGTVTTTPPADATTNVTKISGTAASVNSGNKDAGTLRVILATDQPALTNKLLVTPDSVALPANQSVNQTQWAGTAVDVNSGVKSAGTIRVVLATDQPALTNKLLVTPDSVALPANQSVNAAQLAGTATAVNSGNKDAGTLRVVLATDQPALTNKLLVTPDSVALPANQSCNTAQFGGNAVATGTGAGGVGIPRVTVSNDSNVLVTPPTLTKATQGATGFSTQDLKDAGRNQTNFYMVIQIVTTATDALLALTGYKSGALVAATTTPAVVTAAKTYRLTSVTLEYTSIVTTEGSVRFTLRANTGGVVAIGSPVVCVWEVGQPGTGVSVAGKKNTIVLPLFDGIEFAAGTGIGISQVGLSPVGAAAVAGYGRISITGYEY